jgi:hypothetical protein
MPGSSPGMTNYIMYDASTHGFRDKDGVRAGDLCLRRQREPRHISGNRRACFSPALQVFCAICTERCQTWRCEFD